MTTTSTITSVAHVPTAHASRYLQQLCKHWSHKFTVEFTPEHGRIDLPFGPATLDATADRLEVHVEAPDAEGLARAKDVVARHLDRFAFREAPLPFDWQDG